ncbi:hypothetical protein [Butyrivibrio sp. INlla21]|uniref:hypothetical protein n=1 Tax=Butyrivibrio sp. INlla21 TaxID=1520811 RepID=UPI0008E362B9|nr:hypothetical protein [Butyrivibrio sp. INlla21]SFU51980.1 hypothetical protein SAMN02910342_00748 [Butyrivibrio sp. INlla21]
MKRLIVGAVALTLVLCGCSKEISDTDENFVTSEASATEASVTSEASESKSTSEAAADLIEADAAKSDDYSEENVNDNGAMQNTANTSAEAGVQSNASTPCGVYARTITELYKGKEIQYTYYYAFHKDGTGAYFDGEVGGFKFNDKTMTTFKGDTYGYTLTGDHLRIELPYGGGEFDRLPGDDFVLNGDFWDYAGVYRATDNTNSNYGGGEIVGDLELDAAGMIEGGMSQYTTPDNNLIPYGIPEKITKNADGSYHVQLYYVDEISQCYYEIYPKGVIAERDKDFAPELKDANYIRVVVMDGGVYDAVFVEKEY